MIVESDSIKVLDLADDTLAKRIKNCIEEKHITVKIWILINDRFKIKKIITLPIYKKDSKL